MSKTLAMIRRDAGYSTQAAFSSVLGLRRTQIAKWETGNRYPRPIMLPRIAAVLHVTEGEVIAAITAAKHSTVDASL